MSDLRKRFQEEKENIELQELPLGHQERFLSKLERKGPKRLASVWRVAAGLILVIASSVIYWNSKNSVQQENQFSDLIEESKSNEEESEIPIDDASKYYLQAIDNQFATIEKYYEDDDSKQLIEETKFLIAELQKEYKDLEEELEKTGEEKIVIAMIGNYQKRIQLLEDLILKLKYIKQVKLEENEKSNQSA